MRDRPPPQDSLFFEVLAMEATEFESSGVFIKGAGGSGFNV